MKEDWTIARDIYQTLRSKGKLQWFPRANLESIQGIDITVKLYQSYKSKKEAQEAMDKVIKRLFPNGIEAIDGRP